MPRSSPQPRRSTGGMKCIDCPLVSESEWHVLAEMDQEKLAAHKTVHSFPKGGVVFHQGSPCNGIYCVQSGTIGLRKTDEKGNAVLLNLIHPGQTIGMRSFFAGTEYRASAEALSPATVCHVPVEVLSELFDNNPKLDLAFLKHISMDLGEAHETILVNTSLPVRARLAIFLLSLKDRYGRLNGDGTVVLELPMTRHDIADLLSTRPETVARAIAALTKDGLTRFSGRQVILCDLKGLLHEPEIFGN